MMTFDECWGQFCSHQGAVFHTARGMPFSYTISGGVLHIDRKRNPITRATVELAYNTDVAANGIISGPKALRCFGASYIYAVFQEIGIITTPRDVDTKNVTDKEDKTMARTKGSKNKAKALTLDEQITAAEARVEELEAQLTAAEAELKKLELKRDEEAMKELMAAMADKGMSVEDVITLIRATEREA